MKKRIPALLAAFYVTLSPIAFSQAGSLDLTFDGDGTVLADIGDDYSNAIALQADGKFTLDLSNQPAGIYILEISNDETFERIKLVKQ